MTNLHIAKQDEDKARAVLDTNIQDSIDNDDERLLLSGSDDD